MTTPEIMPVVRGSFDLASWPDAAATVSHNAASARAVFIHQNGITIMSGEIRWDEKAGLRAGCGVRSQVIDVLKAQIKGDRQ
jgi:hypothetical protein